MDLKSYNKSLYAQCKRALNYSFVQDIDPGYEEFFYCSDTDTVHYKIVSDKDKFTLYFFFIDLENVWKFIENYFKQHYYQSQILLMQILQSTSSNTITSLPSKSN